MHDGARLHTANIVLDFLYDTFNSHVILNQFPDSFACGQNWSPYSFFGDSLRKKPQTVMELRALIIEACNKITEDVSSRVISNITVGVEVARCNGGHIEHLTHRE
jgi:hypothetical protein